MNENQPTPHIRLRALEPEDLELLYTIENEPSLWDISTTDAPYSKYALKQYIASAAPIHACGELRLVAEVSSNSISTAVALVDLTNYTALDARAEVGITVLKQYRHQGYGKAALQLIEDFAVDRLRIHSLYAHVSPNNQASWNLFTALGYQPIAQLPDWHYTQGKYEAVTLFQKIF